MSGLTFERFHAETAGLAGHFRAARFYLLSIAAQESCWEAQDEQLRRQRRPFVSEPASKQRQAA